MAGDDRQTGYRFQSLNAAARDHAREKSQKSLETRVREIVKDELSRSKITTRLKPAR